MLGSHFSIVMRRIPVQPLGAWLVLAWLLTPTVKALGIDDVESQLAGLTSEQAAERWRAERWLATNLTPAHLPELARAALAGGSEVQGRLVRALSADGRHMGLCVLLLTDPRKEIAGLGQSALVELLTVWSASAMDEALKEGTWPPALDASPTGYLLEPGRGGLHSAIDRLGRWGQGPMPLILSPSLDPGVAGNLQHPAEDGRSRRIPDPRPIKGTWVQGLRGTMDTYGVSGSVFGWRGTEKVSVAETQPFLLVHKRRRPSATAAEHVMEWCRGVLRPHDEAWNVASARALGTLGWPAALSWLEERWLTGDRSALEGLLAAARGRRFVPSLLDAERLSGLVREGSRDLNPKQPATRRYLEDLARTLAELPLAASQEELLTSALLEGSQAMDPASRWVRLVIWEGQRPGSQAVRARCRKWLEASTSAPMQWQVLRTLGALGSTVSELPPSISMSRSLGWAEQQGALDLFVRDLIAVRAEPAAYEQAFQGTLARRLAFLHWCVGLSDQERGVQIFEGLLEEWGAAELARRCRVWYGSGLAGGLEALVRGSALTSVPGLGQELAPDRLRFLLQSGLATPDERAAAWDRWEAFSQGGEKPSRAQLEDLASLVADAPPRGVRARAALLKASEVASPEDIGSATIVAGRVLVWAGWGPEAENLRHEVHRSVSRSGFDLSGVLYTPDWPSGAAPALRLLWGRDRHLEIQAP
ncbi:MAG: hypothetical protein QF404_00120 [Planctomycetota bacterium]|nr:hypothetical protein [Planctomycetota bacterium]MDP6937951.1 hypothetical protein [Planctomycetota bacterium]